MHREILTKYRTKVIEDFIMIEGYVNAIICKHYIGRVDKSFMHEVMFDELCSSGFKANILEKVLMSNQLADKPRTFADDFRQLSRIRNHFAHCNTSFFDNASENAVGGIPDPRKPYNYLDVKDEKEKFSQMTKVMAESLIEIMDKMGILFIHDTDKGIVTIACETCDK